MLSASELASIQETVASALDTSIPQYRSIKALDTYGHTTNTRVLIGDIKCNIIKPSASKLQLFAEIIGSQQAVILRMMQAEDVQEGDEFLYNDLYWVTNNIQDAESYTVTKEVLLTVNV